MFSKIALESIIQRGKSPFYISLVSLYQKAQDTLYELENPSDGQIVKALNSIKFKESLKALLIKFTNLPINKVDIETKTDLNLMCSIVINEKYKNKEKLKAPTIGTFVEELNRLYDDKKGKLTEFVPMTNSPFICTIHLYSGLFKMRNKDKSFFISSQELAAGTLHEVGHADFFIRNFLRAQNSIIDAADIIDFINTAPDKDIILKTIDILLNNKKIFKRWSKVLTLLKEEFIKSNDDSDSRKLELISVLTTIMVENISNRQLNLYNQVLGYDKNTKASALYEIDNERTADEYASRHGAYAPLISFLTKLDKIQGPDYTKYHSAMYGKEANVILKLLNKFNEKMNIAPEEIAEGYDPLIRRLELIVETAKHAFHDEDLPESVIPELKKDIIEAETYLNQYRYADYRSSRLRMKKWNDTIIQFRRIVASPFVDRLEERYNKLYDTNRSLSRHSLFYLVKK